MKCVICGTEVRSIEDAIDLGWIPNFWEGDKEYGPACASCSETLIQVDEHGEFELKEEYRGKITYLDKDSPDEDPGGQPAI